LLQEEVTYMHHVVYTAMEEQKNKKQKTHAHTYIHTQKKKNENEQKLKHAKTHIQARITTRDDIDMC
jgi:hypothetical protein